MSCKSCAERRRLLKIARLKKKQEGKSVQAAGIGAVLAVTEAAGKVLGIGEDTKDDGRDTLSGTAPDGSD